MPKVWNMRNKAKPEDGLYIGRARGAEATDYENWSNPFSHQAKTKALVHVYNRVESVRAFEIVFSGDWERGGQLLDRQTREAMNAHAEFFRHKHEWMQAHISELQGRDLICWCAPESCHGDVLLAAANPIKEEAKPERYVIALTGHRLRDLSPQQREHAREAMTAILAASKKKYGAALHVLCGMADGIDQIGAQVCVDLGIDWVACVPHRKYFEVYPSAQNDELLAKARKIIYGGEGKPWHYSLNFRRNEYMLRWCDGVLACAKFPEDAIPSRGGTAHMVRLTKASDKKLVMVKLP